MSLRIEGPSFRQSATRTNHFPEALIESNKVIARKETISDITKLIETLGLDSSGDIIFNGTDKVAVQKVTPNHPPYYSTNTKVLLKVASDADPGVHFLIVSGYSNNSKSKGQLASIELNVDVQSID